MIGGRWWRVSSIGKSWFQVGRREDWEIIYYLTLLPILLPLYSRLHVQQQHQQNNEAAHTLQKPTTFFQYTLSL